MLLHANFQLCKILFQHDYDYILNHQSDILKLVSAVN